MEKKSFSLDGIDGVLFDMDGTMVLNMPFHQQAWVEFGRRHGLTKTDDEIHQLIAGKKNSQIIPLLVGHEVTEDELKSLADEKESIYRELYAPHIEPVPGLLDTLLALKAKGKKLAIATTAPKANRDFILAKLGVEALFDAIVGEEDFTRGKPDPELFATAASRISIPPDHCVVFDDAPLGVQTAKAIQMKIIGLTTTHDAEEFDGADLIIENFEELQFV